MFVAVCVSLRPPRLRSAPSRIVACASDPRPDSPRLAVVLVADAAAPERAATDMVTTLRSQGWAVRLASSGAGAGAALAEDPQAVFELQRSASSFALQEECEVSTRAFQPAGYSLLTAHCSLLTPYPLLLTACYSLLTGAAGLPLRVAGGLRHLQAAGARREPRHALAHLARTEF